MTTASTVTWEDKQAASDAAIQAIRALQAPVASTFTIRSDEDMPAITEHNRRAAVQYLVRAIIPPIPPDYPDAPLRADVERWLQA